MCLGGGGIDGVISRMGGHKMFEERKALPIVVQGTHIRCKTGDAVWTSAGDGALKCTGVIHAVGPQFPEERRSIEEEAKYIEQLILTYKSAMELARDKGARSVAFCPISSGIFRGHMSLRDILKIALNSICAHVYEGLVDVELYLYGGDEQVVMKQILNPEPGRC
jgi:O-acetyl-ADP-ribose deacetylase (regulator of RNase III)